jgi:5-methylcytosine-specific restriction endonuclease McrA
MRQKKNLDRWARRKLRYQNPRLKKKLFGHLIFAPCYYCKSIFLLNDLTIEHLTPLILGGTNEDNNIALACAPCNHQKGREVWLQIKNERKKNRNHEQHPAQYHRKNWKMSL